MKLEGSCHCRAVTFTLNSPHPYPFNYCFCSICRKTMGATGAAINLSGDAKSLEVTGADNMAIYHARIRNEETGDEEISPAKRYFCRLCSSGLWLFDSRWPDLIHPFASAIDTELPRAPEKTYLMVESKKDWVPLEPHGNDKVFDEFPDYSIAEWHQRLGLES
ncbi:GFA family protein [Sneathiella sp.]|uniref:GFA family protein n=1 Tax=Sneathiella sp. TaxID=1964365 RepID=UPI003568E46A